MKTTRRRFMQGAAAAAMVTLLLSKEKAVMEDEIAADSNYAATESVAKVLADLDCHIIWEIRENCRTADLVDVLQAAPIQETLAENQYIHNLDIPSADGRRRHGAFYYVSDDGDDANDGLTLKTSLRTVPEVLSRRGMDGDDNVFMLPAEPWPSFYIMSTSGGAIAYWFRPRGEELPT